jgi:hypothetical protein
VHNTHSLSYTYTHLTTVNCWPLPFSKQDSHPAVRKRGSISTTTPHGVLHPEPGGSLAGGSLDNSPDIWTSQIQMMKRKAIDTPGKCQEEQTAHADEAAQVTVITEMEDGNNSLNAEWDNMVLSSDLPSSPEKADENENENEDEAADASFSPPPADQASHPRYLSVCLSVFLSVCLHDVCVYTHIYT